MKLLKKQLFGLVALLALNSTLAQTTYYVDSVSGLDGNTGITTIDAWQSIAKINSSTFNPGDQILFKSGQTFFGKLIVPSSGTNGNQITFGKYGGTDRPIIDGRNYLSCIDATGKEYLTINDLELTNNSDDDTVLVDSNADLKRYGFYCNSGNTGTKRNNFILNNLKIHNIYPSTANGNGEYDGNGILFTSWGTADNNYFDGITIENCEITNVGILGIGINKWESNPALPTAGNRKHFNVNIEDNYIHHTGGSGAVFFEVDGYLFEDNLFTYTGDYSMDTRQRGRGSGFWCVRTSNGTLQYNEFSHAQGPKDSCGAHIDIENDNVIIQYNLSYDNAGGFAEYMGANTNCVYRYNVSINDGWRVKWETGATPASNPEMYTAKGEQNGQRGAAVWFSNYYGCGTCDVGSTDNKVYNNTFYIGKDTQNRSINAFIEFEPLTDYNEIKNNIFYVETGSSLSYLEDTGSGTGNVMQYNLYTNGGPDDTNSDIAYNSSISENEIYSSDPLFVNKGGLSANDYLINTGSLVIDNGDFISSNGGQDYWGNPLSTVPTDIGANETSETLGTSDFSFSSIKIYPNPASDILNVSHVEELIDYSIINAVGQIIKQGQLINTLDISQLSQGIYYLRIKNNIATTFIKN